MKKIFITLASLLVLIITLNNLHAQEAKSGHQVHVKVKKIINGKETIVDSTFTIDGEADLDEIMEKLGSGMGELHEQDGKKVKIKKEVRIERKEVKDGEMIEKEIEVEMEGEDDEDVYIIKSDDEKDIKIRIKGDTDGENVFIMKGDDVKEVEDKDVIIIKNGTVIDMKGSDKDGSSDKKVIRIEMDDDGGEEKMIWHSDDGKVIEIDGDKVIEDKMVFIKKSGDGEEVELDEDIEKLLKEKGIDLKEMKGEKMVIEKTQNIQISVNPIGEDDSEILKKTGLEEKELNSGLKVDQMEINVESDGPLMIQVKTEESGNLMAFVRDTAGELISQTVLKESPDAYKIYLNLNQSGTYYVTLSQGGKSLTQKLVIKKA